MKRILALGLLVGGLAASAPVLAQGTATTYDAYGNPTTGTTGAGGATTTYGATGWDPGMLLALSGGLGAGSLALKGFLRKRS